MKQKKQQKNNFLKSMITSWKKMDSERKTVIIIIAILLIFMICMPYLYKGWVNFRDNGFHFGSRDTTPTEKEQTDSDAGKTLTMTCSQSVKDSDYNTSIKTIITYVDKQLKKEDYTITMKAISDIGKEELPIRKELYDSTEESYHQFKGFTVKSEMKNDTFTFNVLTNYSQIDIDAINQAAEQGTSDVLIDLEFNQSIDSVKSYYESMGLTCKK